MQLINVYRWKSSDSYYFPYRDVEYAKIPRCTFGKVQPDLTDFNIFVKDGDLTKVTRWN